MDAEEIVNGPSLLTWLKGRPEDLRQADGAAIAIRMALRVFPFLSGAMSDGWAQTGDLTALQTLRLLLTAWVQRHFPALAIKINMDSELQRVAFASGVRIAKEAGYVAYAARYAYSVDVSDVFATAAGTSSGPDFLEGIRDDARLLDKGEDPFNEPLWSSPHPDWFEAMDQKARAIWAAEPATWSFWLRWWDGVLAGRPLDWELQKQVALIPDEVWKQGPAAVSEAIAKIERAVRDQVTESQVMLLLRAALADFSFDAIGRVMRMVPFEEDIRHLRDPAALADFLDDADALRDDLELFSRGLAAEGSMQHAGFARTYLDGILEEFSRARQLNHLRVGRVVELGKILEEYAASPAVAAEFGPAIHALKSHLQTLLDLTRRHFAATMTRMAPLRDLSTGPDDDQWTLLQDIQRGIKEMANPRSPDLRPLAADDLNLLLSMAESIERLLRQNDVVVTPQARSSLRREVDHGLALLSVSVALYLEKARTEGHGPGKVLDWIATQYKRSTGLLGLWEIIKRLWT